MKCSELVTFLQGVIAEHGDLPIAHRCTEFRYAAMAEVCVAESNVGKTHSMEEDSKELGAKFVCFDQS
jgi:hypothetical protein